MNKVIKYIMVFVVTSLIINATTIASANEYSESIEAEISISSDNMSTDNGQYYLFSTSEDKQIFENVKLEQMQRSYNPIKTRVKQGRTVKVGRKWVGYNPYTPNWSKANSYNINVDSNISVSATFNHAGVNYGIGVSLSKGVSISLPANANRFSRLGFEVDVELREMTMEMYDTSNRNKIVNRVSYFTPIINQTYNIVKYQ